MPSTVTTIEKFPKDTPRAQLEKEVDLRIKAGAIRSVIKDGGDVWIIETEWNVFGQND